MKKAKFLLLLSICGLIAACGKKDNADIHSTDRNDAGVAKEQPMASQGDYDPTDLEEMAAIPGVQIIKGEMDFSYAYTEQEDGSLLFTVEGTWDENQIWDIIPYEESVAAVKEVSQSKEKVEYQFTAEKEQTGYSEFYINLYEMETDNIVYTIVFSTMSDSENKINVLNVFGHVRSDEADLESEIEIVQESAPTEEITEEYFSEDELEYQIEQEKGYASVVGDYSFPEAIQVNGKAYTDILETKAAVVTFTYEGHSMLCSIAPSLTIEEIRQAVKNSDTWKTKHIGETEVVYYTDNNDITMMWMDEANTCYSLSGRRIEVAVFDEVIQLMLGN